MPRWLRQWLTDHPRRAIETFGHQIRMGGAATIEIAAGVGRRRFAYRELIHQCSFMASMSAIPALIVVLPVAVVVVVAVNTVVAQIGATAFLGAGVAIGVLKQGAPLVTSLVVAGAVGSAICADLGSRTIREEIEALVTMGVDPIRRLVAPRILAAMICSTCICGLVIFGGLVSSYLFVVYVEGGTAGSMISSFQSFASLADLVIALIKATLFGLFTAVIACDHGLNTKGGPGGVANSVNAAVVQAAMVMFGVNIAISQLYAGYSDPVLG